ncbi:hypothetical protein [Gudongella sp. DL1XJH-153]|uniref:lysine 5,6-aminomutase reactivase subunit KamB n=1 Tax=Gudongella sp. DL1XJH-153 TaxID=3409804 RepID=UPI003BB6EBA3
MSLLNLIGDKYRIVSIIGMSKNSGKTVTLNHLIEEAMEEGVQLGLTSIGRDGERLDRVTETEKPRIFAEENTIVATTTALLTMGDANIEIMKVTPFRTPLGEVIIGKVRSPGYIQIAGPQSLRDIHQVCQMMLNLGAKFVVIDGALDRKSSAAPTISDATILSTGAVISRDVNRVLEETLHVLSILSLPQVDEEDKPLLQELLSDDKLAVVSKDGDIEEIGLETALGKGHKIGEYLDEDSKYLLIPGSLVKGTLIDLTRTTRKYKDVNIVVGDGTKIFIPPKDYLQFLRMGISIKVINPINVIGVTINPYAPAGYYFEPNEFLDRMNTFIKDIPVMDIMLGGE